VTPRQEILEKRYNGNVSQYGWVVDGKVVECQYNGCHSQILAWGYHGKKVTECYSFGPNIPPIRLEYMFDDSASPWRSVLSTLGCTKEDVAGGAPLVFTDLSRDANVLVNLMVAARWPQEQIWSYGLWERLLLSGVHPAVADVLTQLIRTRDKQDAPYDPENPEFTTYQYMHSNFIPLDCTLECVDNFVHGRMLGGNGHPFNGAGANIGNVGDGANTTVAKSYKPIIGAFAKQQFMNYVDQLKGTPGEYVQFLLDTYGPLAGVQSLVDIGLREQKRLNLDDWSAGKRFAERGVSETPNGVELRADAIASYEGARSKQSHWRYVQELRGRHAHIF
jgi:hypothetical protein